jgi:NAD(P)-dependent dehydrogenase (short-subunit alcohol dehydrogenase family)
VPRRPGEVAVVTGGARGIGIEIVRKLLILDMHVVIGCRNKEVGEQAVEELLRKKGGIVTGSVNVLTLDLMSFESVKEFGNKVYLKYPKIHLLINNSKKEEKKVGVVYFIYFLLLRRWDNDGGLCSNKGWE